MVILDTSVIIDHLRRSDNESILVKLITNFPSEKFAISVITLQELYEGKSTRDENKENQLLLTLSSFEICGYTTQIATMAGKIARDLKTPIDLADAAIAATAIENQAELFTLNEKHFKNIPTLRIFKI